MIQPPKREWKPAPEAENKGDMRSMLIRIGVMIGIMLAGYFLFTFVSYYFFQPKLVIDAVIAQKDPFGVDSPVKIALKVSNERWEDGAAYLVLAIEGETEIEGPVVAVRARETTNVPLEVMLSPGWRHGTLILFDAYRENVRVDARYGIPIKVGSTEIEITDLKYPSRIRQGETLPLEISVTNAHGIVDATLVPIAVAISDTGEEVEEEDGHSFVLGAGADTVVRLGIPTSGLEKREYFLTVIMTDPATGQRTGRGKFRQPFVVQ